MARVPYKGHVERDGLPACGRHPLGHGILRRRGYRRVAACAVHPHITASGMNESHPHDVAITREAPNYSSER